MIMSIQTYNFLKLVNLLPSADPGGCFGGCSIPGYELQKKKKKDR